MRTLPALLLTLTLALTACGGDDESGDSSKDASPSQGLFGGSSSASSAAQAPEQDAGADQAIADGAVLTAEDLPSGWQAEPNEDNDDAEVAREMAACIGVELSDVEDDANATADSDDFKSPEGVTVSSSAEVAADEEWMSNAFEIQSGEQFRSCAGEALEKELSQDSQGIEWGEVKVLPMAFPTYGDETTAFRVVIPVVTQDDGAVVSADFVMARVGRANVTLSVVSPSGPMGVTEEAGHLQTVVERMQEGLGDS